MQSNRHLLLSLAANLLLLGGVVYLLEQKISQPAISPVSEPAPPLLTAGDAQPEPKPFRWSQLESADYQIYIANLRRIGCPEQTLRDIIAADVGSLYAQKRRELGLSNDLASNGHWSRQEEAAVITALLRPAPSDTTLQAKTNEGVRTDQDAAEASGPTKTSLPLAFMNFDTNKVILDESQQAVIDSLRRKFVNEIGGTNQDPNDPQYATRWQQAQPEIDERLKAMLGYQAYQQLQRQARRGQPTQ